MRAAAGKSGLLILIVIAHRGLASARRLAGWIPLSP
jgi:hypothetical protein